MTQKNQSQEGTRVAFLMMKDLNNLKHFSRGLVEMAYDSHTTNTDIKTPSEGKEAVVQRAIDVFLKAVKEKEMHCCCEDEDEK
jgi:hypothetical protein